MLSEMVSTRRQFRHVIFCRVIAGFRGDHRTPVFIPRLTVLAYKELDDFMICTALTVNMDATTLVVCERTHPGDKI